MEDADVEMRQASVRPRQQLIQTRIGAWGVRSRRAPFWYQPKALRSSRRASSLVQHLREPVHRPGRGGISLYVIPGGEPLLRVPGRSTRL